jgi:hypothetical protein
MRRALPALFLAFVTLLAGCEKGQGSPGQAPTAPVDAGPGVTSLLGGLKKGDALGPATVVQIQAPNKGRIKILIAQGDTRDTLVLTLQGDGPIPIVTTKKYALFSENPGPKDKPMAGEDASKAIEALAERIRASEEKTPTPTGLSSYGPKSESM